MAAGYLQHLAGDRVEVRSAGSTPGNSVNPAAVAAMTEEGIDISNATPKILTDDDKSTEEIIGDQIRLELTTYKGIMLTLLARKRDYFCIFINNCSERYTFRPLHEKKLPLVYISSVILLGTTLTAMENERFHSAVSFIHSKLRSSLSVESVERLTLCKIYLADTLKDQEISLANESAVIEAIDDGNDFTVENTLYIYH
jgi:hypothetical protein